MERTSLHNHVGDARCTTACLVGKLPVEHAIASTQGRRQGYEQNYSIAYRQLVRQGLRRKLRAKYAPS